METQNHKCSESRDTRLGYCFSCAEAESIIAEGLDMYDKGLNGGETPAKTAMEKVELLRQKGCLLSN